MNLSELLTDVKDRELIHEGIIQKNGRYFPQTMNGRPIGSKSGYATMKDAVYTFYDEVLTTFKHMDMKRREDLVNAYMKKHAIKRI
jgi:hypothetical protein